MLPADSALRAEIETVAGRITEQLGENGQGEIQEAKLAIFRGASLFRAERIYTNKSMGGAVAKPGRTECVTSRTGRWGGQPAVIDLSVRRLYRENADCPRTTFAEEVTG
ncbi:hypothetical protein [Streptomyces sp. NPDC127119]|uniref:hypothetical protein n=1 Tax=Streptomyces sp. NPDC127119 TaxID=3345370 RepID=UPI00363EC172